MILDEFFKPKSTAVLAEDNLQGGRPDDEVKFFIDSEPAYYAVMDRFGDHIEFRGDDMVAPLRLWGAIQQTAGDAGGAADIAGLEDEPMWVGDELDEQGMAENYPKHQDLSGISTDKLKAYVAKYTSHPMSGEGAQVRRVRAELQRREELNFGNIDDEEENQWWIDYNMKEGVAEGSKESYIIVRTDAEGKKDVFAGNFDTYERAQKELDGLLAHPLHTKYKQKFEIKRKGGEQGVTEGHGNYAGDRPVNLGGVSMKKIQIGDTVRYIDQKAQVVDMSRDREHARITIPSSATTKTVLTSDLRQLGRGMSTGSLNEARDARIKRIQELSEGLSMNDLAKVPMFVVDSFKKAAFATEREAIETKNAIKTVFNWSQSTPKQQQAAKKQMHDIAKIAAGLAIAGAVGHVGAAALGVHHAATTVGAVAQTAIEHIIADLGIEAVAGILGAGGINIVKNAMHDLKTSSGHEFEKQQYQQGVKQRIKTQPMAGPVGHLPEADVSKDHDQQLSVQQLATISDEALDNAYHYGRSSPGNTFGWQANLKSAAYAKHMIDRGVTDIDQISNAIHRGWNVTAKAFVQNPEQFDDTEKLRAAGKLEAKLQQRAKLMNIDYDQLPDDEQEKDRVVARALLQALTGRQDAATDNKQLDELSPATLARYKTKAGAAATAADSAGDRKTGDRRFSGIVKATKKQFDQDAKQSDQKVHESRLRLMASIIKTQ